MKLTNEDITVDTLQAEIEKLKAENERLKTQMKNHGIKDRQLSIDRCSAELLFGYKNVCGRIVRTADSLQIAKNRNTFVPNLIRSVAPYPRGNKSQNDWIGYKPLMEMSDKEFKIIDKLVVNVIKACVDAKSKLEGDKSNE